MDQLATPAMVIDAATVYRNIARLVKYADEHDLDLRPHTKTHKSRELAALQMAAGAVGLTAAKVGEAEVMSEVADDILVAYPAIDPVRTKRLAHLAAHATVRVGVDSKTGAPASRSRGQSQQHDDRHSGGPGRWHGRTGLQTPSEALKLAQFVDSMSGLRLDGIMCYPGHIGMRADQQQDALLAVSDKLAETLDLWSSHGLQARIVSGGSTPTAYQSHLIPEISEIRPGTYIFNDMNTVHGGFCTLEDCGAHYLHGCQHGRARPDRAGRGEQDIDQRPLADGADSGYGLVIEYPDARITRLSEEHAQVDVRSCGTAPKVGDRVTVIPNHICPCVNLQDAVWWRDRGWHARGVADRRPGHAQLIGPAARV